MGVHVTVCHATLDIPRAVICHILITIPAGGWRHICHTALALVSSLVLLLNLSRDLSLDFHVHTELSLFPLNTLDSASSDFEELSPRDKAKNTKFYFHLVTAQQCVPYVFQWGNRAHS